MSIDQNSLDNQPKWIKLVATVSIFIILISSSYIFRNYIKEVLRWVESQPDPLVFFILVFLYTLVSLPFAWGYIVINLATGYLYGLQMGTLVTLVTATLGIVLAHLFIKSFLVNYVEKLICKTEHGSIIHKISLLLGSKRDSFQLILLSRLTPIPFGLQNSLFAISTISFSKYLQASCLGLLPCQVINVYFGSTLRSMEEVFVDDNRTATVEFAILTSLQIAFIIIFVVFVLFKAQKKLNEEEFSSVVVIKEVEVEK